MLPQQHYYMLADPSSLCHQIPAAMFQSDSLPPFTPNSLMSYMPNCSAPSRYLSHHHHGRNPNVIYRSLVQLPQSSSDSQCSRSSLSSLSNHKSTSQSSLCSSKGESDGAYHCNKGGRGDVAEQEKIIILRHCEKFNELNHPLMAIDCRKTTENRSLSPTDSGVSSQSSSPAGHYQKSGPPCLNRTSGGGDYSRGIISDNAAGEARGTKRHYQNNRTSRSPSPLLNSCSSSNSSSSSSSSMNRTFSNSHDSSLASRPKRRYYQDCGGEGLPPIVPSADLIDIHLRSHRPDHLLNGGEWDRLSRAIWSKYTSHEQTPCTLRRKLRLREMVYEFIRNYYLNQCWLYIVGSSMSGFGGESSDMDLCLVISNHEVDQRFHALEYLYRVQKALKQCRSLTKLDVIRAKVPILRFFDTSTNLEVDLNFNNIVGIRNTFLLKTYARLDWRVRPLVLAVKLWARQHDINDAKSMTMSSYSLTLMVIHYLQAGLHIPVLPCLQQVRAERFWPEADIRRLQPFTEDELKPLRSNNYLTLGQLFYGFLDYYANQFNYSENAISVRLGGTMPIDQCRQYLSPKNDSNHWKYICIEEPFDRTNTARSVYDPAGFQKVIDAFRYSAARISVTKDLSSIMT